MDSLRPRLALCPGPELQCRERFSSPRGVAESNDRRTAMLLAAPAVTSRLFRSQCNSARLTRATHDRHSAKTRPPVRLTGLTRPPISMDTRLEDGLPLKGVSVRTPADVSATDPDRGRYSVRECQTRSDL